MDLSALNKQQKEAVTHKNGPLLIVAGAGTGKTTVLTSRVAWLIDQGLAKPEEILCLTFTDKAAGEMEERIDKLLPYGYVDLWVMTFHAFAERILKQHGLHIGLSPNFRLLDQTGQWMLIHDHFEHFRLDYYRPLGNPTKFIGALLSHFSRVKDEGITPKEYVKHAKNLSKDEQALAEFEEKVRTKSMDDERIKELWKEEVAKRKELAGAYEVYQSLLHEKECLDFGDLILYLRKLFQERDVILEGYRKQFKYILVDEFQDTNWAQYDLVKLLAGDERNVTVVGDDDQSIYKFRGASLSNILGFKNDFPEAKQVVLTENYRSTQDILDLAHGFIQHNNPHRLEHQLNQAADLLEAAEEKQIDLSGFKAINKQLTSNLKKKGNIRHLHYQRLQDEASGVIQKMLELHQQDPDLTWRDFAILVRANSSAEPFLQQLAMAEIPYQFLASQGLFSQPAILDLISYLKLLDDYAESTALYRILILPTVNISNEDLMELLYLSKKESLSLRQAMKRVNELPVSDDGKALCQMVLERIEKHAILARDASVSEVAMAFIEGYELKNYYEKLHPLKQKDTYSLLNHFWRFMQDFEAQAEDKSVKAFLAYIDLVKQAGNSGSLPQDFEEGPDTVKVMTIHASKGLEFEHVFVVNLVDRRFPTVERKDPIPIPEAFVNEIEAGDDPHLEEERRLFYVAITRAKRGLYLTSAEDYGGARKKKLSRFLLELGFEKAEPIKRQEALLFGEVQKNPEQLRIESMDYSRYLPKTFSYSQMTAYERCARQYWYRYILRIPVAGSQTSSFGKSLHKALELFFSQMVETENVPTKEELLQFYEDGWIGEWYPNAKEKEKSYQEGKEMLLKFYDLHENSWPDVLQTEMPFTVQIGKYKLSGSIDRVDKNKKGLKLIDYKSGKMPKSLDKKQLTIYQIVAEEVLEKDVDELVYYYLRENEARAFHADEKQKEKVKDGVIKIFDQLTSDNRFEPASQQQICKNCDFKEICSYRVL